jgi:hypothetical protein
MRSSVSQGLQKRWILCGHRRTDIVSSPRHVRHSARSRLRGLLRCSLWGSLGLVLRGGLRVLWITHNRGLGPPVAPACVLGDPCGYLSTVLQGVRGVGVARVAHGNALAGLVDCPRAPVVACSGQRGVSPCLLCHLLDVPDTGSSIIYRVFDVPALVGNGMECRRDNLHPAHSTCVGRLCVFAATGFLLVYASGNRSYLWGRAFSIQCNIYRGCDRGGIPRISHYGFLLMDPSGALKTAPDGRAA